MEVNATLIFYILLGRGEVRRRRQRGAAGPILYVLVVLVCT